MRGEGGMRKYVLYTQLNVDNFGWPINSNLLLLLSFIISKSKCSISLNVTWFLKNKHDNKPCQNLSSINSRHLGYGLFPEKNIKKIFKIFL